MIKPAFVWDGFGADHAYPKGLGQLFVGDLTGQVRSFAAPGRQISERNLDLTQQIARPSLISGFVPEWAPKTRPRPFRLKTPRARRPFWVKPK
jgi:hypothetical protein